PAALAPRATHAPPGLVGAVERCLSKDRDARFGSGEALADALVQSVARRTELPLPLRAWAEASDPARPFYGAWSAMFGFAFVMELFGDRQLQLDLLGWGALPIVPVVAFELRQMVRLVSQGYGLADVRLALAERRKRRREEIAQTLDERPHRWIGAMRPIGWTGLAALFASATLFDGREVMALFPDLSPRLMGMLIGTSIFGSVGSL